MATTARMRGAASASAPRSRPLFRPPAMSTTESNAGTAATVAWGAVAFESSYQRTPSASPTSVDAVGEAAERAQRVAARRRASRRRRERGRRRGQRVGEVVREARGAARPTARARRRRRATQPVRRRRASRRRRVEPERHVPGAARRRACAHHDRVVGVARSATSSAVWSGPELAPWPPRSASRSTVHVEVVGGEVEPRADARARSAREWREPERRRLDHEHLDGGVVDRGDERHLGVAGGDRARRPTPASIAVTSVVTVVLPSVPVIGDAAAGRPSAAARSNSLTHRDTGRGGQRRTPGGARGRRGSAARASTPPARAPRAGPRRAPRPAPRRARRRSGAASAPGGRRPATTVDAAGHAARGRRPAR